jgi:hypothetical protein
MTSPPPERGPRESTGHFRRTRGQSPHVLTTAPQAAPQVGRLYALALALVVFFLTWTTVAARPWVHTSKRVADPRLAALAAREQRLRHESLVVRRIVQKRWATYRVELRKRKAQLAATPVAAPSVRVVTLPPLTVTRTS